MADTIFERYGGFASVRRIVSDFCDRAIDSPVTGHHFEHVDMRRLLDHQARFVSRDPTGLITELNDIFTVFDRIVEHFGCDRMKTIGDAYMAVSGLPEPNVDHADSMARAAIRMRRYIEKRNASHAEQWYCRIGIHSGLVIGSIVGVQKFVYDVFGPGVNLASRMEEFAEPMQILVSADTYSLIRDDELSDLGEHELKGFGTQSVYALAGEGVAPRR